MHESAGGVQGAPLTVRGFLGAALSGAVKGLRTALMLLKIMIPVYLAVVALRHTDVFGALAAWSAPAMALFRLPGDAVAPLVAGVFADEYAVVAALGGFAFGKAAITTIAMVCLCFHSIPVETVVTRRVGMPGVRMALARLALAVMTGMLVGFLGEVFL